MRRPDPVPASRQPQPERGPFRHPCNHSPAFQQHRHACDAERAAREGHDTQDRTARARSHRHRAMDDRQTAGLGRIPCLPGGYHPVTPAPLPRGGCAAQSHGSINEQHAGCHFPGQDDARHARLIEALSHLGFNVRRCHELVDVYERYSRRPSPLVVLEAPLPDVHNAAVRLRGIDRLGIVAIAAFPDAESRIRTLLCGADACLSPGSADWSWPRSCRRAGAARGRHGRRAGRYSGQRRAAQRRMAAGQQGLDPDQPGRAHHGPDHRKRDFLSRLVHAPDRKVSRDALLCRRRGRRRQRRHAPPLRRRRDQPPAPQEYGQPHDLPIRAVHGWGYMFAADIKLDLDERAQADDGAEEWRRDTAVANATSY